MKLKKLKLDIISATLLIVLVTLEVYIEKDALFHSTETLVCLAIGLVIGFNLGYKLAAMHAIRVSEKAFSIAEAKEKELEQEKNAHKKLVNELEMTLLRERKLTTSLGLNLQDRDNEIRELISRTMNSVTH